MFERTRHALNKSSNDGLSAALARGYWRVAIRRYFLLVACGHKVRDTDANRCCQLIAQCPPKELMRIVESLMSSISWVAGNRGEEQVARWMRNRTDLQDESGKEAIGEEQ